jgi:hypothetical protein
VNGELSSVPTSLEQQKLLAMDKESDRTEERLDDRTVEELMDFLYYHSKQ